MRPRKEKDNLPKYIYKGKSAYEYRKGGDYINLGKLDMPMSELWARYEEIQRKERDTLEALVDKFLDSPFFLEKPKETQQSYRQCSKKILATFGHRHPDTLSPVLVRKYMDMRGKNAKVRANREKAFLSTVYQWGIERGYAKTNPCTGVKNFKEASRERYIEDWEYDLVYKIAPPAIKVAMELSYLCAMRQGDVLKLAYEDCKENGIYVKQGKTGKAQIKAWTPRLREAIALSKTLKDKKGARLIVKWIVSSTKYRAYTSAGFKTEWQKVMRDALENGLKERFTFHDIKAKSISDYEGDKQKFSGHKTKMQVDVYDRKVAVVDTLDK